MKQSAILSLMVAVYNMGAVEIMDFSIEDIRGDNKFVRVSAHMSDGSERNVRVPKSGLNQDWVLDRALDKLLEGK